MPNFETASFGQPASERPPKTKQNVAPESPTLRYDQKAEARIAAMPNVKNETPSIPETLRPEESGTLPYGASIPVTAEVASRAVKSESATTQRGVGESVPQEKPLYKSRGEEITAANLEVIDQALKEGVSLNELAKRLHEAGVAKPEDSLNGNGEAPISINFEYLTELSDEKKEIAMFVKLYQTIKSKGENLKNIDSLRKDIVDAITSLDTVSNSLKNLIGSGKVSAEVAIKSLAENLSNDLGVEAGERDLVEEAVRTAYFRMPEGKDRAA